MADHRRCKGQYAKAIAKAPIE